MNPSKENISWKDNLILFGVSFLCISLELFLTRILNLKTFNHITYVVIPFAILGYGIGANIYLIFEQKILRCSKKNLVSVVLLILSLMVLLSTLSIIHLPISTRHLEYLFKNYTSGLMLSAGYLIIVAPFAVIGFLVLYIFSQDPKKSHVLYFWDLLGAGCGAAAFFFLINYFQVTHSIALLSLGAFTLTVVFFSSPRRRFAGILVCLALGVVLIRWVPEIQQYESDSKGWENFPKQYQSQEYETIFSTWHPLGRTDAYRLREEKRQRNLYLKAQGTFEINVSPAPEFTYLSTNFLGGTPVYKLSPEGLKERGSQIKLFSQAMEVPYIFLSEPKVVVIGTGGGRDIFFAKTHAAKEVKGAEINPGVYGAMSQGGKLHEYSGGVYALDGVQVYNIDGRHLVKTLPANSYDFIVLNGVDTFSGLSTGAYAYAESYLYTKNAVMDYVRILSPDGIVNFNRWIFPDKPRETLRLFTIALDSLRSMGIEDPWQHIIVGDHLGWGIVLMKKSPFSGKEISSAVKYFETHDTDLIYPSRALQQSDLSGLNFFDLCALSFRDHKEKDFIQNYVFDISVITDDNPFFYKYYRLRDFNPMQLSIFSNYGAGFMIFLTQAIVLFNAVFFSILFIGIPLFIFKKDQLKSIPGGSPVWFILYYACLGMGFMFIEIPLMQQFTLFLGSPIYSISLTLAALLIFSGLGSFLLTPLQKVFKSNSGLILIAASFVAASLLLLIMFGPQVLNSCMSFPFLARSFCVGLVLLPIGICLGLFFPSGMELIHQDIKGAMAWAWGINCGFSVFGSMLAIVIAQFYGFKLVFCLSILTYLIAAFVYRRMAR